MFLLDITWKLKMVMSGVYSLASIRRFGFHQGFIERETFAFTLIYQGFIERETFAFTLIYQGFIERETFAFTLILKMLEALVYKAAPVGNISTFPGLVGRQRDSCRMR